MREVLAPLRVHRNVVCGVPGMDPRRARVEPGQCVMWHGVLSSQEYVCWNGGGVSGRSVGFSISSEF